MELKKSNVGVGVGVGVGVLTSIFQNTGGADGSLTVSKIDTEALVRWATPNETSGSASQYWAPPNGASESTKQYWPDLTW